MDKHSRIVATDCYIRSNGKVLMIYRNKRESLLNKRFYRGVGGKIEKGENPFDCIKREVKEEAGVDINPIWKGVVTFSKPSGIDWEAHIFTAEGFEGNLVESSEGELKWIDESDIFELDLPEGDKKLFPLIFRGDKFHAHLKYDDYKKLMDFKVQII